MDGRLLIVDDDPQDRAVMGAAAQSCGYEVVEAASGKDLRTRLRDSMPGVIVLDIVMPDEDGIGALQHLAAQNSPLPIVLVTGCGTSILRPACDLGRAYGLRIVGDGHRKPLDLPQFQATLMQILAAA